MLSPELLQKVRRIEITTRKVINDMMSGQYRSHFKGHGVQFSEHRLYVAGDDVRHIDWKVSARSRDPLVKKYEEERELTVFLVVDVSASENFGSSAKLKSEVAAELCSLLAWAAIITGDRVGVLFFAGEVEKIVPPKKGKQHVLRIIRDVLTIQAKTPGTDLKGALEAAGRVMKHSGVVFVLSDFIAKDYARALKKLSKRHDVVAIRVEDRREKDLPDMGQMLVVDPETGKENLIDTSSYSFKRWFQMYLRQQETQTAEVFKGGKVESLVVSTQADYAEAVTRFFQARARRRK